MNGSPDPRDYITVSRLRRSGSSDALPTRGIPAVSATAAASLRLPRRRPHEQEAEIGAVLTDPGER